MFQNDPLFARSHPTFAKWPTVCMLSHPAFAKRPRICTLSNPILQNDPLFARSHPTFAKWPPVYMLSHPAFAKRSPVCTLSHPILPNDPLFASSHPTFVKWPPVCMLSHPTFAKMTPRLHAILPNTALSCPVLDTVSLQFSKSCTVYALSHPTPHRLFQYWTLSRPIFAKGLTESCAQCQQGLGAVSPSFTQRLI